MSNYPESKKPLNLEWNLSTTETLRLFGYMGNTILGKQDINSFLIHLVVKRKVASYTQKLALCALVFLSGCVPNF